MWPGLTAYPDFSNDVTHEWWYDNLQKFHEKVPFDGLWIVSRKMGDTIDKLTINDNYYRGALLLMISSP